MVLFRDLGGFWGCEGHTVVKYIHVHVHVHLYMSVHLYMDFFNKTHMYKSSLGESFD